MVTLVFFIAVLNLALGFSIALYFAGPSTLAPTAGESEELETDDYERDEPTATETEFFAVAMPTDASTEPLPQVWLDLLEKQELPADSFAAASMPALRLRIGRYLDQLEDLDERTRAAGKQEDAEALLQLVAKLNGVNSEWVERQSPAADHLAGRDPDGEEFEKTWRTLEEALLDQANQIQITCSNLELLNPQEIPSIIRTRLHAEILRLIDLTHGLRDRMLDSLVILLSEEIPEESLDRKLQSDLLTGLNNRMGIERALRQWRQEDPSENRQAAAALIDIDGFRQVNERFGVRQTNRLLESFGNLLAELGPQDGELNPATRYAGQSLALFFPNANPPEAASVVEQIRDAVKAMPFHLAGEEVNLTISCAVVPIGEQEDTMSLFQRLGETLAAAKAGGGNKTCCDEGDGPRAVESEEEQLEG